MHYINSLRQVEKLVGQICLKGSDNSPFGQLLFRPHSDTFGKAENSRTNLSDRQSDSFFLGQLHPYLLSLSFFYHLNFHWDLKISTAHFLKHLHYINKEQCISLVRIKINNHEFTMIFTMQLTLIKSNPLRLFFHFIKYFSLSQMQSNF